MTDFLPLAADAPQRANLTRLATLLANPERMARDGPRFMRREFHMAHFACGTAACAVGWAPVAGIDRRKNEFGYTESWQTFAARQLLGQSFHTIAGRWLFSCDWATLDNTPEGAAYRIRLALEHGIPADAMTRTQRHPRYVYEGLPDA